ncbi:MAG: hypothetical protein KJ964_07600 [Verrucomicrobia bacterium]|nr:hypothetical protein [Verrucomicrobiota bacterium]MBU1734976.1 hypothetical protein [Verrucomicrobiota bacterium]MBU1856656.1 hypothetical protein [Verrucomicrobiota bacterium]
MKILILIGFAAVSCFNAWAGEKNDATSLPLEGSAGDFPPRPQIACVRTSTAPAIDGQLDDPCWKNAMEAGPFALMSGLGFPAGQSRAYLVQDDENLYIGVACDEPLLDERLQRTHEIKREIRQRDGNVWTDDSVELFFQPEATSSGKYYHLAVNSLGTVYDSICTAGNMELEDKSWDSQARVAVSASERAWFVEMAIPKKNLQIGIKPGAVTAFNICRTRPSSGEFSCWSPTKSSFHNSEAFGIMRMLDAAPASREIVMPRFIEGDRAVSLYLRNTSSAKIELKTFAHVKYETGDWDSFSTAVSLDGGQEKQTLISCFLGGENQAFFIDASETNMDKTLCFRTDPLPIRPESTYRISAMVKAENLNDGDSNRPPAAFSLICYDKAGKGMTGYVPALAVPGGSYEWKRIEGLWRSPADAAEVTLWAIKWSKSKVRGKLWVDDIRFSRADAPHLNLVANGSLQEAANRSKLAGWPSVTPQVAGYPKGKSVKLFFQICGKDGEILYSSPVYSSELVKARNASVIGSSLVLMSRVPAAKETFSVAPLYVAQKGYLYLPVVFKSAVRGTMKQCQLTVETPAFLRLADPYPGAILISKEAIQRDGYPYYRHVLEYQADAISPDHPKRDETIINPLFFRCDVTPDDRLEWNVYYYASAGDRPEEENRVSLTVLPPLQWKRPERVPIVDWNNCPTDWTYFSLIGKGLSLNSKEQELVLQTIRLSGSTQVPMLASKDLRKTYGFRGTFEIPSMDCSWANFFPKGAEYLAANPQARAVTAEGIKLTYCFCPTYFLSGENENRKEMAQWLSQKAKEYEQVDWDYEVAVTRKSSICFCARCIGAFRAHAQIAAATALTAENILSKYKKEWVDFRCWQNADIAGLFRELVKKGNPDCIFSVYSGYQGDTDEKYGVDWKYMSKPCDLVWCGYGRPVNMIAATHAALEGRPFIGGELAWLGETDTVPYDCAVTRTALFRRLSDCGSGVMIYHDGVMDGRLYAAVSAVAGVTADFEQFFVSDKDKDGFYHSRYQRNDGLVRVGGDGNTNDVTVLVRGGERLVFVFNERKKARSFEIENLAWRDGMTCVDYFKKTAHGAKVSLQIPPLDVRVLHVLQPSEKDVIDAPELMQQEERERLGYFPVMAWRGKGSRPGDQRYDVEISRGKSPVPDWVVVGSNLAETVYVLPWQNLRLEAGGSYLWRVQARDVVSGKSGPYSSPATFHIPIIEEVNFPEAFSPNGDGCLDQFILRAYLIKDMPWTLKFSSSSGKPLRVFEGRGKDITVRWDGNDSSGNAVGKGDFTIDIQGGDSAVSAYKGKASINMKAGVVNPAFAVCRNFILTVRDYSSEGTVKMEYDYAVTRGKTCSIRMNAVNKVSGYWSNYCGSLSKKIPVTPGKKYAFRAYLKSDLQSGAGSIALTFFKAPWGWAGVPGKNAGGVPSEPVTGKTDWVKREVILQAPPTADSAVLRFAVDAAAGTCWFDDMEFSEVE